MSVFSARASFPAYGVAEEVLTDVRITQEEYRHDVAVFTVPYASSARRQYQSDTPVRIDWSRDRDSSSFVGVVHHTEPDRTPGSRKVKVWCKGASQSFDDGLQRTWYWRTVPSVFGEIARSYHFDTEIQPHGRVYPTISAEGGRAWEFMVAHAHDIGYSLYAKNTRLMLHPRTFMTQKFAGQAPVLRRADIGERGSLFTFAPIVGAQQPGTYRVRRTLSGIDRRTGVPFSVTGGPAASALGQKQYTTHGTHYRNLSVSTPAEARWELGAVAERERFNITATALAEGHPRVHQTWPVILDNVDHAHVGLWFVKKVEHIFTQTEYLMELELGRDGLLPTVTIPDSRAKRVVTTRNTPQGRAKAVYPPSVLRDGQWRSQWSAASRTFGGG